MEKKLDVNKLIEKQRDINTQEGLLERIKTSNIKELNALGIDPSEELENKAVRETIVMEKKLDINTLEGWNEMLRSYDIKDLIEQGVEPTEENIKVYRKEQEKKAYELIAQSEAEKNIESVPTFWYVGLKRFDTEEKAKEYKEHISKMGKTIDTVKKMFNKDYLSNIPLEEIRRLKDSVSLEGWGELGADSTIYLLGYLQGVRAERVKKRTPKNMRNI